MRRNITAFLLAVAAAVMMLAPLSVTASAEPDKTSAPPVLENVGAAVVYNIENDRYIYELDADKVIYPASTVKLMTAIVVLEALDGDLDREITVESAAIVGVTGNRIALKRGEVLTAEQLLYALICGGANDAATVLAYEVAGGIEQFTLLMNKKARELGATHTFYTNPTGMHDSLMVTTARDTAIIATYAYKLSPICDIASVEKYVIEPTNKAGKRTIFNKNYYYSTHMEYKYKWDIPRGLNAGYTPQGGNCVVTTATRAGLTYVVVVMGAEQDDRYIYSYTEAADLVKWAFDAYSYTKVLTTADIICEMEVKLSAKVDHVTLFPSETFELFLPSDIDIENDVELILDLNRDYFTAPVSEGESAGTITLVYNGETLGTCELITHNSVSRNNILYVLDLMVLFTKSRPFRIIATTAAVLIIGYIAVAVFVRVARIKRYYR